MPEILIVIGNVLLWSGLSFVLATIISLLAIRLLLGVKVSTLLAEIEDRQNAAVGVIFKDTAAVISLLVFTFTTGGFTEADNFSEAVVWVVSGGLLTALFFIIFAFIVLRIIIRHKRLQESALHYLRRELIQERNQALAHIMMAFLLIVGIAVVGQII